MFLLKKNKSPQKQITAGDEQKTPVQTDIVSQKPHQPCEKAASRNSDAGQKNKHGGRIFSDLFHAIILDAGP
jgi:hypothetical protein